MDRAVEGRVLYTVGHGAGSFEDLASRLKAVPIGRVVDVRTAPGSRRHPQFARDALETGLAHEGIAYEWRKELGGFRRPRPASPHVAIRNESFRGYADHMDTREFRDALAWLEATSVATATAVMCAESVWWRCHRRMIADALLVHSWRVHHLMPDGRIQPHALHPDARVDGDRLIYDAGASALDLG